jgi:uncharacterized protein
MLTLPAADGLTVLTQVTNRCQLKCPYCMATKNHDDMSKEMVLAILHGLAGLIPGERPIQFVWHGGEPLLMGVDFYRWVRSVQEIHRQQNRKIGNVYQTNGLLLTDPFLDFISESQDFYPNISMDGPDFITKRTRGVSSAEYDDLFVRLQQRKIPFGVAVVASELVLQHRDEVASYFIERGISDVGLVPYHAFAQENESPSPTALYSIQGLKLVQSHVTRHKPLPPPTLLSDIALNGAPPDAPPEERVNLLGRSLMRGVLRQAMHSDCRFSSFDGNCHKRALCIATNGELYPCPRGQNVGLWSYGNVMKCGLDAWWATTAGPPPFRPKLPTECTACKWKDVCHGGCPANAHSMNGGAHNRDYYCPSFVKLFEAADDMLNTEIHRTIALPVLT